MTTSLATRPLTVETVLAGLAVDPTPVEATYVRNNLDPPVASDEWSIELVGVATRRSASIEEIFAGLPRVEQTTVLQCAGNGRRRLPVPTPGVQWDLGGMACVDWSGVRLGDLADAYGGVVEGMRYLTVLGGDADEDDPARVERSVPVEAALADGLVVDRMNGDLIPWVHGGPIRFVMPGYFAVNSVKWVRRIAFTEIQSSADIQVSRYRMVPDNEFPSLAHASLWAMGPVSHVLAVERTGAEVTVTGVAFSGGDAVVAVEVTSDGQEWVPASLGSDRGRFAWRRFQATVEAEGAPWVASRCHTANGVQPERSKPNRDGYAVDGWRDLAHHFDT